MQLTFIYLLIYLCIYRSPLFCGWSNGNKELIEYLVEHTADINKEDRNGVTPLFNTYVSKNKI